MAIMRFKEITAMSAADRAQKLLDLRAELSHMKTMVNAGGAVENPTRIRELRKIIAQILTVQNEEKIGIRKPAEQLSQKTEKTAKKTAAKKDTKEKTSQ